MFNNPIMSAVFNLWSAVVLLLGGQALYFSNVLFAHEHPDQWFIPLGARVLAYLGVALLVGWLIHVGFAVMGYFQVLRPGSVTKSSSDRPSATLPDGSVINDPKGSLIHAERTLNTCREISHRVGNTVYMLDYPDKTAAFRTIQPVLKWDDQVTPHPYSKVQGIWVDDHNGSLALYGGHIVRVYAHSESSFRITYLNMAHPDSFPTLELAKQFAPSFAIAVLVKTLRSISVPEADTCDPLFQHI